MRNEVMIFIKLSFQESYLNVCGSWRGIMLHLQSQPEITEVLPRNVRENKKVNVKRFDFKSTNEKILQRYDYFLACDGAYDDVKHALKMFMEPFEGDNPAILMREQNPHHNPIINKLDRMVNNKVARHFYSHSLFGIHEKVHPEITLESQIEGKDALMRRLII